MSLNQVTKPGRGKVRIPTQKPLLFLLCPFWGCGGWHEKQQSTFYSLATEKQQR